MWKLTINSVFGEITSSMLPPLINLRLLPLTFDLMTVSPTFMKPTQSFRQQNINSLTQFTIKWDEWIKTIAWDERRKWSGLPLWLLRASIFKSSYSYDVSRSTLCFQLICLWDGAYALAGALTKNRTYKCYMLLVGKNSFTTIFTYGLCFAPFRFHCTPYFNFVCSCAGW